jgi:PAS domain S-box-containing protein
MESAMSCDLDRLSSQVLATALRDAPTAIGVCDEDGRFLAISKSMAQLLRRPAEQIIGHPYLVFVHPDERPASLATYFEAVVSAAAGIRSGQRQLRCLTGSGDVVHVLAHWTVTEPGPDGTQYGIIYLTELPTRPLLRVCS